MVLSPKWKRKNIPTTSLYLQWFSFAAFLAELAGIEDIIGAFLAGLGLNRLIPHSSALMNRIEFMGNSLFIPIFLLSVGMLVDVRVIFSGYTAIVVALTLSVVAIAGKWLAAYFTQLVFKYTNSQRKVIFGLKQWSCCRNISRYSCRI
jgi:Kef-type K+ transport system membrane component KefB